MDRAEELIKLSKIFKWDGDLMRCRSCKRGIHITRAREPFHHRHDCKNAERTNPWGCFRNLISTNRGAE